MKCVRKRVATLRCLHNNRRQFSARATTAFGKGSKTLHRERSLDRLADTVDPGSKIPLLQTKNNNLTMANDLRSEYSTDRAALTSRRLLNTKG